MAQSSVRSPKARTDRLAEVMSSSVTSITAQSLDNDDHSLTVKPMFGSFISIDSVEHSTSVIAVVHNVITGPPDNVHRPSALGLTREQLRIEQPQIFALLRTEIHAAIVGYVQDSTLFQRLPPHPPEVHDFVYAATREEVIAITREFDFLRLLTSVSTVPSDELLAAAVREAYEVRGHDDEFLVRAGQALSNIFRQDFDLLVCMLRKIKPASL